MTENEMPTNLPLLGIETANIGNPHRVPAELDQVLPVRRDIRGYSETAFLSTWNPADGVGLLIHVGRCPQDIDLWYAQTIAYLPEGRLAVDRSWGRSSRPDLVQTGNLTLNMGKEPGAWRSTFDGAAELSTAVVMSKRPTGAGVARPMHWEFGAEAAGPIWDLYTALGHGNRQDWAQGTHTQQVLRIQGRLVVDGIEYSLDGVGSNDHSSGPRNLTNFGSHHLLIGAFPGATIHCMSLKGLDGTSLMEAGTMFRSGDDHDVVTLTNLQTPSNFGISESVLRAHLSDRKGVKTPIQFEVLHHFPLCLNKTNDNVNGLDWDQPDQLMLTEARVRMTLPNGLIGYGHLERSVQGLDLVGRR